MFSSFLITAVFSQGEKPLVSWTSFQINVNNGQRLIYKRFQSKNTDSDINLLKREREREREGGGEREFHSESLSWRSF